jgi:hypothetical protein
MAVGGAAGHLDFSRAQTTPFYRVILEFSNERLLVVYRRCADSYTQRRLFIWTRLILV